MQPVNRHIKKKIIMKFQLKPVRHYLIVFVRMATLKTQGLETPSWSAPGKTP